MPLVVGLHFRLCKLILQGTIIYVSGTASEKSVLCFGNSFLSRRIFHQDFLQLQGKPVVWEGWTKQPSGLWMDRILVKSGSRDSGDVILLAAQVLSAASIPQGQQLPQLIGGSARNRAVGTCRVTSPESSCGMLWLDLNMYLPFVHFPCFSTFVRAAHSV